MSFEDIFRKLESAGNPNRGETVLCRCRKEENGKLILKSNGRLLFLNNCASNKACFKIRFDSKKSLSERLNLPKSRKKKKKKRGQFTLDYFFGLDKKFDVQDL